jgi:hypothetical protein
MSLYFGYLYAHQRIEKKRIMFIEIGDAPAVLPYLITAESDAEAQGAAHLAALQYFPAAEGWRDHTSEMYPVPEDMLRAGLEGLEDFYG